MITFSRNKNGELCAYRDGVLVEVLRDDMADAMSRKIVEGDDERKPDKKRS